MKITPPIWSKATHSFKRLAQCRQLKENQKVIHVCTEGLTCPECGQTFGTDRSKTLKLTALNVSLVRYN